MNRIFENFEVQVRDEPTYSPRSADNLRSYNFEYCRSYEYRHASAHGINVLENGQFVASAIVLGVSGATGVNENSIAYDGTNIYVAAGDSLFALSLPSLILVWCKKVDWATCFGVFWLKEKQCLITWGEIDIGCYTPHGEKVWSVSGPDIFTEGFTLESESASVIDFNGDLFSINLNSGEIVKT